MRVRAACVRAAWAGLVLAACVSSTAPGPTPPKPQNSAPPPVKCPAAIDLAALLRGHEQAFGTAGAVQGELPLTRTINLTQGTATATCTDRIGEKYRRTDCVRGPLPSAEGIDETGPWEVSLTGVASRLRSDEAASILADDWIDRRLYLGDKSDDITCSDGGGRAIVVVRYRRPELGDPTLAFDLSSFTLVRATITRPDGSWAAKSFDEWREKDPRGVRWPARISTRFPVEDPGSARVVEHKAGVDCGAAKEACYAPPPAKVSFTWPKGHRAAFAFDDSLREVMVRAKIGGREVWALVDSGAGISVIDSTSEAAKGFKPAFEARGSSATEKVSLGFGEIESLELGALKIEHLPAAAVAIPAFQDFGKKRPEVVLGYSLFQAAAIRVDYAKREVVLAEDASELKSSAAVPVAIRDVGGKVVAKAEVNQLEALFEIDTGNSGAFDLFEKFASARELPGKLKSVVQKGRFSAGTNETVRKIFRLPRAKLGPLETKNTLSSIDAPPDPGSIAGLVGNAAFARCRALTFDVPHRQIWFEGPCDRPVKETGAGWRLVRRDDPAVKDRPWVISGIIAGGGAQRAGIQDGDRLLELGGRPATLDLTPILELTERPFGTSLPALILRGAEKKKVTLVLTDALAP